MSIKFDSATREWYLDEPTQEEKDALITYAVNRITAEFGETLTEKFMDIVQQQQILKEVPSEVMGQA